MQVYFATSNKNKYREAKEIIGNVKRFEFNGNTVKMLLCSSCLKRFKFERNLAAAKAL